jgi:formylglycine-generating enzyme required for sulfatase activity
VSEEEVMSSVQRLEAVYESKQQEWQIIQNKLTALNNARAIETDVAVKFKIDQQIQITQQELNEIENDLTNIEDRLNSEIHKTDSAKQANHEENISSSEIPDIKPLLIDPFEWCHIPSGFVEVLNNWNDIEGNAYIKYRVGSFHISKYPITYDQYRFFVHATDGYCNEQWWEDNLEDGGEYDRVISEFKEIKLGKEGLVPALVTRFDAMAFCRWLSYKSMYTITIPTEAHWQRAAQGDDGRKYPWGNIFDPTKCNSGLSGIKRLTPVTQYRNGASSYGVQDLSGNSCEWCVIPIKNKDCQDEGYYFKNSLGHFSGSFHPRNSSYRDENPDHFRCAYRGFSHAPYTTFLAGFRLCLPSPISTVDEP